MNLLKTIIQKIKLATMPDSELTTKYCEALGDSMFAPRNEEEKRWLREYSDYYKNNIPSGPFTETIQNLTNMPYNLEEIPVIYWTPFRQKTESIYLIENENQKRALSDILKLNDIVSLSCNDKAMLDALYIKEQDVRFSIEHYKNWCMDFSYLEVMPCTPTGKAPKYPLALHFTTLNQGLEYERQFDKYIAGSIYYLQNGTIGKYKICRYYLRELSVGCSGNMTTNSFNPNPFRT